MKRHDVASCLAAGCVWLATLQAEGNISDLGDPALCHFVASHLGVTDEEARRPSQKAAVEEVLKEAGIE